MPSENAKRSCFFILNEKTGAFFMTTPKKTAKISGNEARELSDLSEDIGIRFKYPNSERVYLQGSRDDIRVPLREIRQDDTYTAQGTEANPPIPVYDTSGAHRPETRPAAHPHGVAGRTRRYRNPAQTLQRIRHRMRTRSENRPSALQPNHPPAPCQSRPQCNPASLRAPRHYHARNGVRRHTRTHEAGRAFQTA